MTIKSREDFERAYDEWLMNTVIKYGVGQPIIGYSSSQFTSAASRGHMKFRKENNRTLPYITKDALAYLKSRT